MHITEEDKWWTERHTYKETDRQAKKHAYRPNGTQTCVHTDQSAHTAENNTQTRDTHIHTTLHTESHTCIQPTKDTENHTCIQQGIYKTQTACSKRYCKTNTHTTNTQKGKHITPRHKHTHTDIKRWRKTRIYSHIDKQKMREAQKTNTERVIKRVSTSAQVVKWNAKVREELVFYHRPGVTEVTFVSSSVESSTVPDPFGKPSHLLRPHTQ